MKLISKQNFEKLCLIEQQRIYEQNKCISILFWLNNNNELHCCTVLNLLGIDSIKNDKWDKIVETQLRDDFQQWLLQDWQEQCLIN